MSSPDGINNGATAGSSGVWEKLLSKKHQTYYWFNSVTGASSWVDPNPEECSESVPKRSRECSESVPKRRRVDGDTDVIESSGARDNTDTRKQTDSSSSSAKSVPSSSSPTSSASSSGSSSAVRPDIAIIVPYRDLHVKQSRKEQLDRFIPEITKFMDLKKQSKLSYRIYIIEQSNDDRKFNRGKLLNIGFQIACKEGCKALIFHDVDLIPSAELQEFYYRIPDKNPIHIARVWDRYSVNKGYFGGITSFSKNQFDLINGFPNNFWGWGGEDDELYKRTQKVGITSIFPTKGEIEDMEKMDLSNKLQFLRDNKVWKCMNKTEVLAEHSVWRDNGLSSLDYRELSRTPLSAVAVKITVDVCENKHWTDLVCGVSDTQMNETADNLKLRYDKSIEKR